MAQTQSSEAKSHFFEGTEKLLEIWFSSGEGTKDLRTIKREQWDSLLEHVHCQILSVVENEAMQAYLLSESSMFVSKNRFILKTCGQTTLLAAIPPLLRLAQDVCGCHHVKDVFYSRKRFLRPELQHSSHQSFEKEISFLDGIFDGGIAYTLGRVNGDCWYLYTINSIGVQEPDQTLELLMEDLEEDKLDLYFSSKTPDASQTRQLSGIAELFPEATLDDFLFEPCGYSVNGLLAEGHYFTIHITPEPNYSYVSFETNAAETSYQTLIDKILRLFKPKKFLMTLFTNECSRSSKAHDELSLAQRGQVDGYSVVDLQLCNLKNYVLSYTRYNRQQHQRANNDKDAASHDSSVS